MMVEEDRFKWHGGDVIQAEEWGIKDFDYKEMQDLMHCVCKWPNFIGGSCVHCGRNKQ